MNDKLWALAMAGCGTYAPGLEKVYMPKKGSVRIRRLKKVNLKANYVQIANSDKKVKNEQEVRD